MEIVDNCDSDFLLAKIQVRLKAKEWAEEEATTDAKQKRKLSLTVMNELMRQSYIWILLILEKPH